MERLEGLLDEPRLGAPRSISDARVEEVITKTLESNAREQHALEHPVDGKEDGPLADRYRADLACFRTATASRGELQVLQKPQFVEKVRDIVGLYLNPPDRAIVLCVDEKSQVQALNRTEPILPLRHPGYRRANRMTTNDMESRHCLRPWMWPVESRSAVAIDATGTRSSCGSSTTSTRIFPAVSTFIW